jgi:hypothetical protein
VDQNRSHILSADFGCLIRKSWLPFPQVRDGSKDASSASRSGRSSRGVAAQRATGDLDSRTMGVAPMVRAVSSGGDTAARSAFSQVQRRSCDWIGSAVLILR